MYQYYRNIDCQSAYRTTECKSVTSIEGPHIGVMLKSMMRSCSVGHYKVSTGLGEQKASQRSTSPRAVFGTSTRDAQAKVTAVQQFGQVVSS